MSQRPKRSRKMVNYGEDHLHWIEETQLQKALLRSLHTKDSPSKSTSALHTHVKQTFEESMDPNADSMSTNTSCSKTNTDVSDQNDDIQSSCSKQVALVSVFPNVPKLKKKHTRKNKFKANTKFVPEDSFELRLTRLQSKLLEEAGMLDDSDPPCDVKPVKSSESCLNSSGKKQVNFANSVTGDLIDVEGNSQTTRLRAQRKFACNASPPRTRSSSPAKMHKHKPLAIDFNKQNIALQNGKNPKGRAVRASSSESNKDHFNHASDTLNDDKKNDKHASYVTKNRPLSLYECTPNTGDFLSYLCFRNTTVKVELHDCLK